MPWFPPDDDRAFIDGRDPVAIEHLCIDGLVVKDGPVEDCCADRWREEAIHGDIG